MRAMPYQGQVGFYYLFIFLLITHKCTFYTTNNVYYTLLIGIFLCVNLLQTERNPSVYRPSGAVPKCLIQIGAGLSGHFGTNLVP